MNADVVAPMLLSMRSAIEHGVLVRNMTGFCAGSELLLTVMWVFPSPESKPKVSEALGELARCLGADDTYSLADTYVRALHGNERFGGYAASGQRPATDPAAEEAIVITRWDRAGGITELEQHRYARGDDGSITWHEPDYPAVTDNDDDVTRGWRRGAAGMPNRSKGAGRRAMVQLAAAIHPNPLVAFPVSERIAYLCEPYEDGESMSPDPRWN